MDNELSRPVYELITRGNYQYVDHIKRNFDDGESAVCDQTFITILSRELKDNPTPSETRLKEIFEQTKQPWPEPSGLSDIELRNAARKAIAEDAHLCSFMARREGNHKKANDLHSIAESIRTSQDVTFDEWTAEVNLDILANSPRVIATGFTCIDNAFNSGIESGTYNIITAESNIGKTTILVNLAKNFAKDGKRVLFVTFEETQFAIVRRFAQNILKTDMFSIPKINDYQKSVVKIGLNNITIVAKPSGSMTVDEFLEIPGLESYDILILDYYVHFKTNPRNETHEEVGRISKALMAYAKDKDKQVWTAAQSNREGYGKKDMAMTNIGKSLESVQVADTVFGAKVIEEIATEDTYGLELKILKDRQGANRKKTMTFIINKKFQTMEETEIASGMPTEKIGKPKKEFKPKKMEIR